MNNHSPIRVAFTPIPRRLWTGGYNYQSNLFGAVARYCSGQISPVLFAGRHDASAEVAELGNIPGVEVVEAAAFDQRNADILGAIAVGLDLSAVKEFRAAHIDVLFESARFFGWHLPFPAIAWFPDLQHRRLPHLFSRTARWRRDLGFRIQMASGRSILLSSNSALRDFREFYPGRANSVAVVHFASEPAAKLLLANPLDVRAQYDLPSKFFYLPNHLWKHKNHQLVLQALALLKARAVSVVVVASGSTGEPREPGLLNTITEYIAARGLETSFRHVGMIPMPHVYALLRTCVALVNPSKFEGWSTTVEEAKSFGVPMILSDIDVHFEQTGGSARYFGVDNSEVLADHLASVWAASGPIATRELRPDVGEQMKTFAEAFVQFVRRVHRS